MLSLEFKDRLFYLLSVLFIFGGLYGAFRPVPFNFGYDAEPLAEVVSITNILRHKEAGNIAWQVLDSLRVLRNGDYLFTSENSSALIRYFDGAKVELGPNTLIEIKKNRTDIDLNIKFGAFKLILSGNTQNVTVRSNKETLKLKSSASDLSVFELNSELRLDVLKGTVKMLPPGGQKYLDAQEKESIIAGDSGASILKTKNLPRKKVEPLSKVYNLINKGTANQINKVKPSGEVEIINSDSLIALGDKPAKFSFRGAESGFLEISKYPDFSIIDTRISVAGSVTSEQTVSVDIKEIGKFYWRFNIHQGEFVSKEPLPPIAPSVPSVQNLEPLPVEDETYLFKWDPVKNTEKYELIIYELSGNWVIKKKAVTYENEYLWREDVVDSYRFKVRAVDKWGRKSKFSKAGKLLSPISPFIKTNQRKK